MRTASPSRARCARAVRDNHHFERALAANSRERSSAVRRSIDDGWAPLQKEPTNRTRDRIESRNGVRIVDFANTRAVDDDFRYTAQHEFGEISFFASPWRSSRRTLSKNVLVPRPPPSSSLFLVVSNSTRPRRGSRSRAAM